MTAVIATAADSGIVCGIINGDMYTATSYHVADSGASDMSYVVK